MSTRDDAEAIRPAFAALEAVVRVLRRRDPILAELVEDLAIAAGCADAHLAAPLVSSSHGMIYASPKAVIHELHEHLAAFERAALRAGPKSGDVRRRGPQPLSVKVISVEMEFERMAAHNPRPARKTWELLCLRLWREPLKQTRKLPGHVVDAIVTGRTHRSRALHLVAASQGTHADPETLRRRIQRDPRAANYREALRAVAEAMARVRSTRRGTRLSLSSSDTNSLR